MKTRPTSLKILVIFLITMTIAACHRSGEGSRSHMSKARSAAGADVRLGIKYLEKNNIPMAKTALLRAMQDDPTFPATWYTMGYFLEVTGKPKIAEEYYRYAIKLAPRSGIPLNNYATFLCRHKKYKEAVKEFDSAANEPTYVYVSAAYENAGLCALHIPDVKLAKMYFQKALRGNPNQARSLLKLAKIYYEEGNITQARVYFSRFELYGKPSRESEQVENLLTKRRSG